eukprot:CAMPEP_0180257190 /NCGR_PEP_ID=MMETSP0987-20121128/41696_1 /TAXON_ID=697907 /ORGANISM="non described non described, Strain CCMP2293" /LENGTH=77 /DNA_ID=CAMNT_0022226497 /DNA_START=42 /DNA_END=272 /DNA_ORIENTATION=-
MVAHPSGELFSQSHVHIDRHPIAFVEILNAYRNGFLPVEPPNIAPETWASEVDHFRMLSCTKTLTGIDVMKSRNSVH